MPQAIDKDAGPAMRKLIHWISICAAVALLAGSGAGCTSRARVSYHLKRADRYFDSGQYQRAEIEYENVLRVDPQNPRAWDRLGDIYFNEGRGPETVPVLLQAEKIDPMNLDVHLKLAASYLAFSQPKESAKEAAFVLSQNPRDEQAPLLLASSATNDSNAVGLRLQDLQRKGDSAALQAASGIVALHQNDFKTAADCLQRAVALNPKFSEAYTALGLLFLAKKDLKQADRAFQTAASLAPVWSGNGMSPRVNTCSRT
jgi:Tfp pilus assembly protein PilF